jgi:GTPase
VNATMMVALMAMLVASSAAFRLPARACSSRSLLSMSTGSREDLRNVAIIAHVDHGKTTLVDSMIKQSGSIPGGGWFVYVNSVTR